MSLLAPASCDQPLGIIGGLVAWFVCMLFRWGLQAGQGGTGGAQGMEAETGEYPMRTRETPWQLETG